MHIEDAVVDVAINIRGNPLKLGECGLRHVPPAVRGPQSPSFSKETQWPPGTRPMDGRPAARADEPGDCEPTVAVALRHGTGEVRRQLRTAGRATVAPGTARLARAAVRSGWLVDQIAAPPDCVVEHLSISTAASPEQLERDPTTDGLPGDGRRLEAESIRDALLAVSEELDDAQGGSLLTVKNRAYFFDHTSKDLTDYSKPRRSLYLPIVRNNVYDFFPTARLPDAAVPTGDRNTTTVAPQALLMMNSEWWPC